MVQTGRGAGWHHFGGLSAPVLCWYGAYHRPGRLTTGLNAWVQCLTISQGNKSLAAELRLFGPPHQATAIIATLDTTHTYRAAWNGEPVEHNERYPGVLEIQLPPGASEGHLDIITSP
jgi:hypothetical protein